MLTHRFVSRTALCFVLTTATLAGAGDIPTFSAPLTYSALMD